MTYFKSLFFALCLCTFSSFANENASNLDKELEVFKPYLGTWQADFKVPEGAKKIQDVGRWERALNGKAIRTMHSINEGEYGGESMIFYDSKRKSLVFYYFTTAGFYTKGTITVLSPTQFVAYEEVTGSKEGVTKVKSTSDLKDDKFIVSTSYLKKGEWTKPESRSYTRSTKTVKFK
ncbi:hypothetical protein QL995_15130 [Pseudoalteromonas sp. APC 3358]|uniref:hypothetical protein n=1 Tax=unclassified Pseudoalteromonas TaxID=194690 RepID=UPI000231829E|nr:MULTISPECIES: hypothetical protein [unclassified Pseudoalteromonas]MBH0016379.1 hypothetical protein [Pseudoalteromonas sp. NGC95]MDN3383974.1 hypothetical protein [Pseudoalteromonas sp. APC 3358]GAA69314.1 hypothetical protein P20429_3448 [Pseudoalteromonas sp. BSi20429]